MSFSRFLKSLFIYLFFLSHQQQCARSEEVEASTSIVKTNSGPVKGISKTTESGKTYHSFQHIPYAQTPKDDLRFRDPKPVEPWTETLDCTKEGSPARSFDIFQPDGPKIVGSDDCLGVNIFTPDLNPAKPLPVFVWIHGGGFVSGSSSIMQYGCDYIVEKDVICVSFNYRLGIFGFLSFKDPKVGIPGNAGLKDQSMALKWIKENIVHFGGDADNITLAGESAGGASVHYHMISPMSQGLFNRAIVFSGSVLSPWATSVNYDKYLKKFAMSLGLTGEEDDATIFKAIQGTEPEKLIQLSGNLLEKDNIIFGTEFLSPFVPQVEPYISEMCFIPKPVKDLGRDAWSKDLDAIFGGTANEGYMLYLFAPIDKQLELIKQNSSLLLLPEMRKKFTTEDATANGNALKELYFKDDVGLEGFVDYSTERQFWHPIHRAIMQRQLGNGAGLTYVYYLALDPSADVPGFYDFTRKLLKISHKKGTCHSEDLPLLFKPVFTRRWVEGDDNYKAQQAWLNFFMDFTKYGKMSEWTAQPKGETKNLEGMAITRDKVSMEVLPNMEKLRVWDKLYEPSELV